jgi:hypothetical protein
MTGDLRNLRHGIDWRVLVWAGHEGPAPEAGVAVETWAKLLRGERIRSDAMARIARYLRWPLDFRDQLLAGAPAEEIASVTYGPLSPADEKILRWLEANTASVSAPAPREPSSASLLRTYELLTPDRRQQLDAYAAFLLDQQGTAV